ncbi:MAG TPA: hypothetical protein VGZ03_02475 [Acidimicrobiales bacterium]|nr:hypothetical protein [Acidimicrobiales bacterium]
MTTKDAFTEEEWATILEGPTSAGMLVITASRGGTFRETLAESKVYAEARAHHGASELLDEIVSTRPKTDHTRYHSVEELRAGAVQHLTDAVALLTAKATPAELDDYRGFVRTLCDKVAAAHKEGDDATSAAESAAIQQVTAALGVTTS